MGQGGFGKVASKSGAQTGNENIIPDFSLSDDFPENLISFLHLEFSLSEAAIITIIDDGIAYQLNNNLPLVGKVFRSIEIEKGQIINAQVSVTQTNMKFKMALEG